MMLLWLLLWIQPIQRHLTYMTEADAPVAYRHRDPGEWSFHRYYLLIGQNGDYCVVNDDVYYQTQDGQQFSCDWQPPHQGVR